jgi:LysR family hydrogen peroxide-inducible transcriptional activator
LNIRDLRYFLAVVEQGHFGKAAKACHTSQPTLSMQIKKLEQTLGISLIERDHKKIRITALGMEVAAHARSILSHYDQLLAYSKTVQDPAASPLHIGAFPTVGPYVLPVVIPTLHQHFPRLPLFFYEEKTADLLQQLHDGTLDAAILALPFLEKSLSWLILGDENFLLAVHSDHPWATKTQVALTELAGHTLLLLEEGHCLRDHLLDLCHVSGSHEYTNFRATSLETLRQMVLAGMGITLIPRMAATPHPSLRYIPFSDPKPSRTLVLAYRASHPRQPLLAEIAQHIRSCFLINIL